MISVLRSRNRWLMDVDGPCFGQAQALEGSAAVTQGGSGPSKVGRGIQPIAPAKKTRYVAFASCNYLYWFCFGGKW